jgi:hypothetical protein
MIKLSMMAPFFNEVFLLMSNNPAKIRPATAQQAQPVHIDVNIIGLAE